MKAKLVKLHLSKMAMLDETPLTITLPRGKFLGLLCCAGITSAAEYRATRMWEGIAESVQFLLDSAKIAFPVPSEGFYRVLDLLMEHSDPDDFDSSRLHGHWTPLMRVADPGAKFAMVYTCRCGCGETFAPEDELPPTVTQMPPFAHSHAEQESDCGT